jgi:hypothetical protein
MSASGPDHCRGCRHLEPPARPDPYTAGTTTDAAVLKAWNDFVEKLREVEKAERERYRLGAPFRFPPKFYSWCRHWTVKLSADAGRNETEEPFEIYEIAARHNPTGECTAFEPLENGRR